ncbi:SLC13 family permease [Halarchaeum nitratireducens]|uniref:Di- and tricarboxylate transporter n=1 Tax=Halarchaeum nitratireducens TaxID=489913 RepID=A0A830GB30_9EURY|nr:MULTISPECIES: DASS family sodium-coupled anion symporter [Halarchaeum]MBP2250616.1 sodium-dependent dicarboxylate transporter 2/3/5 [Halarchaeum solikamskense]GGN15686.1 di- and tricarboxylate transporter [Halarchaeum nitratireducens]
MIRPDVSTARGRFTVFGIAVVATVLVALAPTPAGLSIAGQYAIATMVFAGICWVTGALPLAVTALSIPVLLTAFGVYGDIDAALAPFADHLIFLFIAGFMLANGLQKYDIDRRVALWLMATMGSSPRKLVAAVMIATAFFSMWVSNTATSAMMAPIAVGVLTQVIGREELMEQTDDGEFTNIQVSMLLGTAYAASVGGVGTLIGTPPNAIVAGQLQQLLNYEITFFDWLLIGIPIVVITLPIVWFVLTYVLFPPDVDDVSGAREEARTYLREEGDLPREGRIVAGIFGVTAFLWVLGGLGDFLQPYMNPVTYTTVFGGSGETLFGTTSGHQGLLYYVMVGLYAVPALVLFDTMEWEELEDIDWGTILLFGGGLSLAAGFAETGATKWIAESVFNALTGAPIVAIVFIVTLLVIFLTEMTSNTATATIIVPVLISLGGVLAATLGLADYAAAIFLAVSGAVAASFAFALPVATPPNAIVFGSGYLKQKHMMRAGVVLNLVMTAVLTVLIYALFRFVWPVVLW